MFEVNLESGKYTVRMNEPGDWEVLRHGEPWPAFELNGPDNLHMAMAYHIDAMGQIHARELEALKQLRPHWAQGYSTDSVAAQAQTAALSQLWAMLKVESQTDAVQALRALLDYGSNSSGFHNLAMCVARLNPKAGEIGPGMLASLVQQAQMIVGEQ